MGTVSLKSDKIERGFPDGLPAMPAIGVNQEEDRVYVGSGVVRLNFARTAGVLVVDVNSLSHIATHPTGEFWNTRAFHAF